MHRVFNVLQVAEVLMTLTCQMLVEGITSLTAQEVRVIYPGLSFVPTF